MIEKMICSWYDSSGYNSRISDRAFHKQSVSGSLDRERVLNMTESKKEQYDREGY